MRRQEDANVLAELEVPLQVFSLLVLWALLTVYFVFLLVSFFRRRNVLINFSIDHAVALTTSCSPGSQGYSFRNSTAPAVGYSACAICYDYKIKGKGKGKLKAKIKSGLVPNLLPGTSEIKQASKASS